MRTSLLVFVLAASICRCSAQKPGQGYRFVDPEVSPVTIEDGEGEALRPQFHITAQYGWMNDPNGPMEFRNVTHVFFQWNPAANVWGAPSWGHVASRDRVFWKRLPPALVPDVSYDVDGVFSGSAALQDDNTPMLLYTGVSRFEELQYYYQQQAAAVPVNASDPDLARWMKVPSNPLQFDLPSGGTHAQFRDPITPFVQDGKSWTAIGGQVKCVGSAILYSSEDLLSWDLEGELGNQISVGQTDGSCPETSSPTPGNENCDQMGEQCRSWECPDFFPIDDIYVLKWSDQINTRNPFAVDWYVISSSKPNLDDAEESAGVFSAKVDGVASEPKVIDYGSVYASKSWNASDGRRLWIGWVFETAAGCAQQCSQGTPFTKSLGWQGAQTIPRVVTYDSASKTLLFNPIAEISNLRIKTLFAGDKDLTNSTPSNAVLLVEGPAVVQSELQSTFSIGVADGEASFTIGLVLGFGNGTEAEIFVNGSTTGSQVTQAGVFIDRSYAGGNTNETVEGGVIPLPTDGIPAKNLELHVLIDRSLIEIFALGGRGRIASRVYPEGMLQPNWQLRLYGSSTLRSPVSANANVWQMSDCWVTDTTAATTAT